MGEISIKFLSHLAILLCLQVTPVINKGFQIRTFQGNNCPRKCVCDPPKMVFCYNAGYESIPRHIASDIWKLDLKYNNITSIEEELSRFKSLENLDLSNNKLIVISNRAFLNNRHLKELYFERNNLTLISFTPMHWTSLGNLLSLNVAYNNLGPELTTGMFEGLSHLQFLELGDNGIRVIPEGTFWGLKNLTHLKLNGNQLNSIPKLALSSLTQLQVLELSDNPLTVVGENSFPQLPHLDILLMNSMKALKAISNVAFTGLTNLRAVEIRNCPLFSHVADGAFKGLDYLNIVYLDNNSLYTLNEDVLPWGQMKLEGVHLYGNPWHCDCHLEWLSQDNRYIKKAIAKDKQLTCHKPLDLEGLQILSLGRIYFMCHQHKHIQYPSETEYEQEKFPKVFAIVVPICLCTAMFLLVGTVYLKRMRKNRGGWLLRSLSYGSLHKDNLAYRGSDFEINTANQAYDDKE